MKKELEEKNAKIKELEEDAKFKAEHAKEWELKNLQKDLDKEKEAMFPKIDHSVEKEAGISGVI